MENRGRKGKYCQYIANMAIWYDIEAPYIVRYDTDLAVLQYYYEMSILPIFVLFVLLATLLSTVTSLLVSDGLWSVGASRSL